MPRYRLATAGEQGVEIAERLVSLNATLIEKGINTEIAEEIIKRVAGAACSNGDGHCTALARIPGSDVMRTDC
jgi:hypothetical protein